jgi:hypothetical protein
MKNLKVILSLLPAAAFVFFIFLSTNGSSAAKSYAPAGNTVMMHVTIWGSELCHLGNSYTYCINGVSPQVFPSDGMLEFPCDATSTICIKSNAGCCGSWTGYLDPCNAISFFDIPVVISSNTECCDCFR